MNKLEQKEFPDFISLKEIKEEIIFNETSIKYTFRLQPTKRDEKIKIVNYSNYSYIMGYYP